MHYRLNKSLLSSLLKYLIALSIHSSCDPIFDILKGHLTTSSHNIRETKVFLCVCRNSDAQSSENTQLVLLFCVVTKENSGFVEIHALFGASSYSFKTSFKMFAPLQFVSPNKIPFRQQTVNERLVDHTCLL